MEIMLPPLAGALTKFTQEYEYSWHTPGHTGGTAFLKSPVGRVFFDFYGENLLRSDLSISVGALGSLLDHTGPIGEHEKYAARVFGAHRTYCVTNGTSMSNRVIFMAAVGRDQIALCDRNCHKSIEHSLVMTGGIPTYLVPLRNRYGIIGPIPPARLKPGALKAAIKANPLVPKGASLRPVYSVVTNSTYDGLIYHARRVEELLDPTVDRIHFDEAWYAYARFNPIYRDRHAMHGDPKKHKGPTVFATHSTHKLLAALSQASFLHIRDGRSAIPHSRFNESYMMQASTSPLYPIIVSNDITAAMMDGPGGLALTSESIEEAVAFRQTMGRVHREFARDKEWFFNTWNADTVKEKGKKVAFADASPEHLARDAEAWVLHPGEQWHGFGDLEDGEFKWRCALWSIPPFISLPICGKISTVRQTVISGDAVPVISMFYGIIVSLYFVDNRRHKHPHVHVKYQGDEAVIAIPDGEVLEGHLPPGRMRLVLAWIEIHKDELLADWQLAESGQQPFKIEPLR
jgi:arginine/lysine/ornithine decarboxylase